MLDTLLQIFKGPPLWVWFLLAYLIFIGIKAFKPSVISLKKIFILPVVFLFFSLQRLVGNINFFTSLVWITSTIIGVFLSVVIFSKTQIIADKKNNLLKLPGTYSTLFLILISFSIKFYFGFQIGKDPSVLKDSTFFYRYIMAATLSFGMFLGRTFLYFYKFKKAESTDLLKMESS
ncbi:MAG: hypothetical protein KR126chlam4_00099 [Candidatus Anoxychlamydiales bacterium]|nr:hypothetical protein [Candidatus Anoxychlamydiales bacterium]